MTTYNPLTQLGTYTSRNGDKVTHNMMYGQALALRVFGGHWQANIPVQYQTPTGIVTPGASPSTAPSVPTSAPTVPLTPTDTSPTNAPTTPTETGTSFGPTATDGGSSEIPEVSNPTGGSTAGGGGSGSTSGGSETDAQALLDAFLSQFGGSQSVNPSPLFAQPVGPTIGNSSTSGSPMLRTIVVLAIVAGAAYLGYRYYQKRKNASAA